MDDLFTWLFSILFRQPNLRKTFIILFVSVSNIWTRSFLIFRSDLADAAKSGTDCSLRAGARRRGRDHAQGVDPRDDPEDVRAKLARVVPGLNDLTFAQPPPKSHREFEVRVVQVTTTVSTSGSSPSHSTSSAASGLATSGSVVSTSVSASTPSSSSGTPTASSTSAASENSSNATVSTPAPASTIQVRGKTRITWLFFTIITYFDFLCFEFLPGGTLFTSKIMLLRMFILPNWFCNIGTYVWLFAQ